MISADTETHFLIEPICLVCPILRRIIRGKINKFEKNDQNSQEKAKNLS